MARVLIIEDDKGAAQLLGRLLAQLGHESQAFPTAKEGWDYLRQRVAVDLVVLDNFLGESFGWEFLELVRQSLVFRDIPVIVYTGRGDRSSILRYIELGVQNILTKPYAVDKLQSEAERGLAAQWRKALAAPVLEGMRSSKEGRDKALAEATRLARFLEASGEVLRDALKDRDRQMFQDRLDSLRMEANRSGLPVLHQLLRSIDENQQGGSSPQMLAAAEAVGSLGAIIRLELLPPKPPASAPEAPAPEKAPKVASRPAPAPAVTPAAPPPGPGKRKKSEDRWWNVASHVEPAAFAAQAPLHTFAKDFTHLGENQVVPLNTLLYEVDHIEERPVLRELGKTLRLLRNCDRRSYESIQSEARVVELGPDRIRRFLGACGVTPTKEPLLQQFVGLVHPVRVGGYLAALHWLRLLREQKNPLRLEALVMRQLFAARLAREMADPDVQSISDELEKAVLIRPIGEWVQALLYPGIYGLFACLRPSDPEKAQALELRLLGTLQQEVGCRFLESLGEPDLLPQIAIQQHQITGLSGRAAVLGAWTELGYLLADVLLRTEKQSLEDLQLAFVSSPAWSILRNEDPTAKLRKPDDWLRDLTEMAPALCVAPSALLLPDPNAQDNDAAEAPSDVEEVAELLR